MVMNEYGRYVPVAWLLTKHGKKEVLRDFLDKLALRAACEEGSMPHERTPYEETSSGGMHKAHIDALRKFCPSHMVIDVDGTEIAAIDQCMWGRGLNSVGGKYVIGLGYIADGGAIPPPPVARIIYCLWHLKCAWAKKMRSIVPVEYRDDIMSGLKLLCKIEVRLNEGVGATLWFKALNPLRAFAMGSRAPNATGCRGHRGGYDRVLQHVALAVSRVRHLLRNELHARARALGACVLPRWLRERRLQNPHYHLWQRELPQLPEGRRPQRPVRHHEAPCARAVLVPGGGSSRGGGAGAGCGCVPGASTGSSTPSTRPRWSAT